MAGFDAGTVVAPLDFTFLPYVNCHGTIKEPTDEKIAAFLDSFKILMKEVREKLPQLGDDEDFETLMEAMEELDPEVYVSVMHQMAEVYADLCSDHPSKEEILAVPPRARNKFYEWLQGELMDPEAVTGDGAKPVSNRKR